MSAAPDRDLAVVRDGTPGDMAVETWAAFSAAATEEVPTIIDNLWPQGAVGFIAAPPKKGKTWLGLSLAISVATGTPFLSHFNVPTPRPVLLLALEGHRSALRGRIGCLARGQGIDPDSTDLDNLHICYKPVGLNLNEPAWVNRVTLQAQTIKAAIVIVDVLRAAANLKENDNQAFSTFITQLRPLTADGTSIAINHHFGKLTEISKERAPGERMSGAGAMYGAFDVGVFITGSEEGARKLRIEFELRDLASPHTIGARLAGDPTGINGGFTYHDIAYWKIEDAPEPQDLTASATEVRAWLEDQPDQRATTPEIAYAFDCSEKTIDRRRQSYIAAGIDYTPKKGQTLAFYQLISPDTDTQDNVQLLSVSRQKAPIAGETHLFRPDMDNADNYQCPDEKPAYLQGISYLDTLDSLTESVLTVSSDAPEAERLAHYDTIYDPEAA